MIQRILGIDYGIKKVGLAIGIGDIVEPYGILKDDFLDKILKIVKRERIGVIILGLPLISGKPTKMSKQARFFGESIKAQLADDVKVVYVDESGTSKSSVEVAVASGMSQKRRRNDDSIAACQIIKRFIEDLSLSS